MLRAGPFSDERVVRLANRRFVPFYFDLDDGGAAGDARARKFVTSKRKELAGSGVPTPPVLFMTPEGNVVGEVSNYASTEEVLAAMKKVLAEHPERNAPAAAEKSAKSALDRAEIAIDLGDDEGARAILEKEPGARAQYLLGRLARMHGDWAAMERHFERVDAAELQEGVRMERAYPLWEGAQFAKLRDHLEGFPKKSPRYTEARYFEGLAFFHLGEREKALGIWKSTIEACAQDPWIYRADWAYSSAVLASKGGPSSTRTSVLGRIGYMGRSNPDLEKRDAK